MHGEENMIHKIHLKRLFWPFFKNVKRLVSQCMLLSATWEVETKESGGSLGLLSANVPEARFLVPTLVTQAEGCTLWQMSRIYKRICITTSLMGNRSSY